MSFPTTFPTADILTLAGAVRSHKFNAETAAAAWQVLGYALGELFSSRPVMMRGCGPADCPPCPPIPEAEALALCDKLEACCNVRGGAATMPELPWTDILRLALQVLAGLAAG